VRRRSSVQVAVVAADNVAEFRHQHRDVGDDGLGRSAAAHWWVADGRAVMLATWNARASLADTPLHRNDTAIPATLNE